MEDHEMKGKKTYSNAILRFIRRPMVNGFKECLKKDKKKISV